MGSKLTKEARDAEAEANETQGVDTQQGRHGTNAGAGVLREVDNSNNVTATLQQAFNNSNSASNDEYLLQEGENNVDSSAAPQAFNLIHATENVRITSEGGQFASLEQEMRKRLDKIEHVLDESECLMDDEYKRLGEM